MTRKDYILIAAALRDAHDQMKHYLPAAQVALKVVRDKITDALSGDNPRFDSMHFLAVACGEKDLNSRPARTNHVRRVMAESENV